MGVKRDYMSRTMDQLADEALEIIRKTPGLRCGTIGDHLFGDHARLLGTAPYARITGKVMRKLEREGKAVYRLAADGWDGWYPSAKYT